MNIDLIIKRLRLAITTFHGIVCHTNGAWGSNWKGEGMNALYAYFAYGSNLMPDRLLQRCPTAVPYAPAILPNYRLTERLYADVDFTPRAKVHGFVYLLRAQDVARLDRYEGYPRIYCRYTVDVILGDGTELPALIYEMTPKTKEIRNGLPYPEDYRKICREGANLHRIHNHFIRKRRRK